MNPHEHAARLAKTLKLLEAIDRLNAKPRVSAAELVAAVRDQDVSWWSALAESAKVNPPSEVTRAAVLDVLERRAQDSATGPVASPPGLLAPSRFSDPADTEPMLVISAPAELSRAGREALERAKGAP